MTIHNLLAVFVGGGVGSVLRYAISYWVGAHASGFPTATLLANFLSCIVLGLGWFFFAEALNLNMAYKLMVLVGFCGGFSTFSTFSLETLKLLQAGQWALAALYVAFSILLCILALFTIYKYFQE